MNSLHGAHHGHVSFVAVSDLIRDRYNENVDYHQPFVISTSFMTAEDSGDVGENVKDEHEDDLDTIDECCDYNGLTGSNKADGLARVPRQTIKNSDQVATSQFSENSSLKQQQHRLLACHLTPGPSKSPQSDSSKVTISSPQIFLINSYKTQFSLMLSLKQLFLTKADASVIQLAIENFSNILISPLFST